MLIRVIDDSLTVKICGGGFLNDFNSSTIKQSILLDSLTSNEVIPSLTTTSTITKS